MRPDARDRYQLAPHIGEAAFLEQVVQLARLGGWMAYARLPEMATENPPLPIEPEELPEGLGDLLVGTLVCDITLAGEPTTKARPRFNGKRTYTDSKTVDAENALRWQFRAASVEADADHILRVELTFRSSTGQRRDLDNLIKLVLDAANGFVWRDDVQVTELIARVERRSAKPGTDLRVQRVGRYTSDCRRCGTILQGGSGKVTGRDGYCSRSCYDIVQRVGQMVACPECGKPVYRQRSEESKAKFCSRSCSYEHKRGARGATDASGYPTLTLVHPGRGLLVFAELKAERGRVRPEQQQWLDALQAVRPQVRVHLWRPSQFDEIADLLLDREAG